MTNFQIYRKVISFSLMMFLVDIIKLVIVAGLGALGFIIFNKSLDLAIAGLLIGIVVGIIIASLITIFISNRLKAAQIAMMSKGVNENQLPDHPYSEGFKELKGRFGKITVFFFVTRAIKGIFRQIGRTFNRVGRAIGGQAGDSITSAINSGVQAVIGYLSDCCLGWVMFRKDQNAAKSACEGAVIFFKHGKTLVKNIGRIFGMGLLSFIVIGGLFFGLSYLVFMQFPDFFNNLSTEIIANGSDVPEFVSDPNLLMIYLSAILGIVIWSMFHSVLIRPFILIGVLRNFMAAGKAHIPSESEFAEVANKSPRFAKLAKEI